MFRREAEVIGAWLGDIPREELTPLVNIGSGSTTFREHNRPWIDQEIFAPLRKRAIEITHVDIKAWPGVDLVADILSDDGFAQIRRINPKMVLLTNVLEHVYEPKTFMQRSFQLIGSSGHLFVTVPRSYPHHGTIDTMLRPTPEEIVAYVPAARVLKSEVIDTGYHWHEIARNPTKIMAQKLKWLFVPYKVSIVILAPNGVAPSREEGGRPGEPRVI